MIKLNAENGSLQIDENSFGATTTFLEIEFLNEKYKVITQVTTDYKLVRIPSIDKGESALIFLFHKEKLDWISIALGSNYNFPPFSITEEEKTIVKKRLDNMGGERNYHWGSVTFNEDSKGGFLSIIIKHK